MKNEAGEDKNTCSKNVHEKHMYPFDVGGLQDHVNSRW